MTAEGLGADLFLTLTTGVFWTIAYINIIWIGFRQKTFAIPVAALAPQSRLGVDLWRTGPENRAVSDKRGQRRLGAC